MVPSQEPDNREVVRIIPLGGLEEIGRNMMLLEYKNQLIAIDAGLKFPEEDTPGIDFIIPNIKYLKNGIEKKVLAVFITHAHYDHIGAIPYIMNDLGNPPIYTTPLARGIILKRQEDFHGSPKLKIIGINKEQQRKFRVGPFIVEPFHINHNIPDSVGLCITTPVGKLIHTCDFKFDFHPVADKPADLSRIVKLSSGGIDLLLSDSTGAENPGHSLSEKEIGENLEHIIESAPGRVIAATFASLIGRIQQIIWIAEKFNRKVVIEGFSMRSNMQIAERLGYVSMKKGTVISVEESLSLPPEKVIICCTGAQGEDRAALMRIANREHKSIRIQPKDMVIFSSSVVPGNERSVQNLKDSLAKQGAKVYHYKMLDIHASGHGYAEDLKLMINLVKPKYFMPIHGQYYMLKAHAQIAQECGVVPGNIIIASNGQVIEIKKDKIMPTAEFVPTNYVMVDGLGVGDVGEIVLRDRQMMSRDGMFVVIAQVDSSDGSVRGDIDIISRGFVYLRESQNLLRETRQLIRKTIEKITVPLMSDKTLQDFDDNHIKNELKEELGMFLFKKTERRPMILPVVIKV